MHTITTTPTYNDATIPVPDDGDKVTAYRLNAGDGPISPTLQILGNNDKYLTTRVGVALAASPGTSRGQCYSTDGVNVVIVSTNGFLVTVSGLWQLVANASGSFSAATALGTALGNSTRYYVYVGYVTGVQTNIVSTTAPEASLSYMTGSTDNAYISTFITDGSGVIVPFVNSLSGRKYRYLGIILSGGNPLCVVSSNATVGVSTAITPGIAYPSFAMEGDFIWELVLAGAISAGTGINLYPLGVTATGWTTKVGASFSTVVTQASGTTVYIGDFACPITPGTVPQFLTTQGGGGGTTTLSLFVSGFHY